MRGYLAALAVVGVLTGAVALVRVAGDVENASMLYLLGVLFVAVLFGSGPATLASVASFLAFNYFFVVPRYEFSVADDEEWIALGLLLVSGVITGQLASLLRDRARDSERREKEAVVLYDVVRLMTEPDLQRALTGVAERLRAELDLAAVMIALGGDAPVRVQADAGDAEAIRIARESVESAGMILAAGHGPTGSERAKPGRWIRVVSPQSTPTARKPLSRRVSLVPVRHAGETAGSLILVRREGESPFQAAEDRLLSAVASQVGLALERQRLQRRANEAEVLRRTDELRTALLNAVSHDLRTPLASIMAAAGSLAQTDVEWTRDEENEFIESIVGEAERLNRLVSNLLDLSRIESGNLRPEKGWYDLPSLVREVAGRLRRVVANHRLELDVPEEMAPVSFDYVEVDQVLSNLIENAVRYTPEGTTIRVSVRAEGAEVRVAVEDTGPGIAEADLPQLFKPFYRGGRPTGRPQGSGLGLAIARGLIEAHGGRIWAENRPEGGARFAFVLPAGERPAAAA